MRKRFFSERVSQTVSKGIDQKRSPETCGSVLLQKLAVRFFLVTLKQCQTIGKRTLNEMMNDLEILVLQRATKTSKSGAHTFSIAIC